MGRSPGEPTGRLERVDRHHLASLHSGPHLVTRDAVGVTVIQRVPFERSPAGQFPMIQDAVTMTAYSALLGIRLSEMFRLQICQFSISAACAQDIGWTVFALLILHKAIRRERQNLAALVGGFTATEPQRYFS